MVADPHSFDAFYSARAPRIVRSIYLRTGDATRAEECVQEAFIRAWRHWGRLEGDNPVAWVTTVAWRLAVRDWRRALRENALRKRVANEPQPTTSPPDELVHLRDALSRLSPTQRDVLILFYIEDFAVRAVAAVLEMPETTVKSHLHRGRQQLRTMSTLGGASG